ncbi:protein singles bar [Procambarus clarkii]|uniref:protein singles bar n=1 Tax=Procambarus clarkii TaxID=6728 RepID=UPI001E66FFB4|nr:protein singles bar-like [Procambarus clarkii]XP_045592384.1 protein singles bar-like [Procambarus clarkii]
MAPHGPSVGWSAGAGRPTVVQPSAFARGGEAGINCGCCTCCTCIHLGFLRSKFGWLKIIQLVLSAISLTLVMNYGLPYSSRIGESFTFYMVTNSACILVVSLLTFCYLISANSFSLIRSSVLEVVFNTLACLMYLTAAPYLSWSVQTFLWISYLTTPYFTVYPAMTATYILGLVLGVVHGVDAWLSYRTFSGRPC